MKKEYILSINPCIYGLNYHDPSVAIFEDGKILVAVEEERLNGVKGAKGFFPEKAIEKCLNIANLKISDINKIAIPYDPNLWGERLDLELDNIITASVNNEFINEEIIVSKFKESNIINRYSFFNDKTKIEKLLRNKLGIEYNIPIEFYGHHLSHIASAYYASNFESATGIVVDGIGEASTTTIWKIQKGKFEKILDIKYPNSLGYFYAIATAFLGFKPWEQEGKLMALAPYGKYNREIMEKLATIISLKNSIYDVSSFVLDNSTGFLMVDMAKAISLLEQLLHINSRKNGEPILEIHKDFAWAIQHLIEEAVIRLVNDGVEKTGIKKVCAAGGIFMNCKMNMVVRENANIIDFFVQPLAGDLGLVIGSGALASQNVNISQFNTLSFGPKYSNEQIKEELGKNNLIYSKSEHIERDVALLLNEGKIVCWFQGAMEMGARALGNRSILADPRGPMISDIINERVKHRENWRPFACSMLDDCSMEILNNKKVDRTYPFMIEAFKVKGNWIDKIPAVIHKADKTTRPQLVSKFVYPRYYNLINEFYKITGCPLILNTSFNDKGQPIVESPKLAIEFFKKNDVDILAIGDYIAKKK